MYLSENNRVYPIVFNNTLLLFLTSTILNPKDSPFFALNICRPSISRRIDSSPLRLLSMASGIEKRVSLPAVSTKRATLLETTSI